MDGQVSQSASSGNESSGVESTDLDSQGNESGEESNEQGNGQQKFDSKSGGQAKNLAGKTKTEQVKALKRLAEADMDAVVTIKVDGETRDVSVRDAIRLQQLEQVSRKKLTEADQLKRQITEVAHLAKTNPRKFMEMVGVNPVEFAEATLAEQLEILSETPEQRELREYRTERAQREQQDKQTREEQERQKFQQMQTEAQTKFNNEFLEAWKDSGLPADRLFSQLLAAEMVSASDRGEDLNWKQAAAKLKPKFYRSVRGILEKMDAPAIQDLLGDVVLKKVREEQLRRVSGAPPSASSGLRPGEKSLAPKGQNNPSKPKGPLSEKEYRAWIASLKQ